MPKILKYAIGLTPKVEYRKKPGRQQIIIQSDSLERLLLRASRATSYRPRMPWDLVHIMRMRDESGNANPITLAFFSV